MASVAWLWGAALADFATILELKRIFPAFADAATFNPIEVGWLCWPKKIIEIGFNRAWRLASRRYYVVAHTFRIRRDCTDMIERLVAIHEADDNVRTKLAIPVVVAIINVSGQEEWFFFDFVDATASFNAWHWE